MARQDFLKALSAGDNVVVGSEIRVVERTTKTQILIKSMQGIRFRKSDGGEIGANAQWRSKVFLREATDTLIAKAKERKVRVLCIATIESICWHKIKTSKLLDITSILDS